VTSPADRPEQWPVHEVEDVWSGPAPFSVRRDLVSAPAHPDVRFGRLVVEHPGATVVLAVDEAGRALVVEQYRHPAGMRFVELPAGLLDVLGEDPLVAAKRELLEEAAHTADEWTHLLTTYPSPGLSAEKHVLYLARGLHHVPDRGGFELHHEEADMTVSWVPVDDLLKGVLEGRLTDGPLALAVMAYRMRGY
jgi:8-oxo-dGTP pyrophosphatase MutT (NUDIX family)